MELTVSQNYELPFERPLQRGPRAPGHFNALKTNRASSMPVSFRKAFRNNARVSRFYNPIFVSPETYARDRYATDYVITDPGQNFKMPHVREMTEMRRTKIAAQGKKPPAPIEAKTAPSAPGAKGAVQQGATKGAKWAPYRPSNNPSRGGGRSVRDFEFD